MMPRSLPKQLSNQHPNLDRFWNQLGSILGRFWEPSWSQDRTKSLPKSIPRMIKKMITFWMPLEIDFDQVWLQFGGVQGGPFVYFLATFSLLGPSWLQDGLKMAPRGLKRPQDSLQDPFWSHFGCILEQFWSHSGAIWGNPRIDV